MAAFRFALQASNAASPAAWRDLARKAEDLGYSTLYVPGPPRRPVGAHDRRDRGGGGHHDAAGGHPRARQRLPAPGRSLAKEAATLDIVTGGRFEFGLGAGWMTTDYDQSGHSDGPAVGAGGPAGREPRHHARHVAGRERDVRGRALPGDRRGRDAGARHPRRPAPGDRRRAADASSRWPASSPTSSASCPA